MNIIIATGIFPPDIGGPATYSKLLAEELNRRGHRVIVITYGGDSLSVTGYQLQSVSMSLPKGIRHIVYFLKILRYGVSANVIYAQDTISAGFPASLAALILRKRFAVKIVGDHAWEQSVQRFGVKELLDDFLSRRYGWKIELLRKIERFVAGHTHVIIVPSKYLHSVVMRWGVPEGKIEVIYNAVPVKSITISKEEARKKLDLDGFILLSAGRLVPWKGFKMLVELMPRLSEKISNAKLIVVGDGPDRKILEAKISNMALKDTIQLKGAVSKEDLSLYFIAADIFCLNTGYEGFSHQLIEALNARVPIVTTNAGGNKEIVYDGENALVAQYNDLENWKEKIICLYNNQELRDALSHNPGSIQHYSIEDMIQKTEHILTGK